MQNTALVLVSCTLCGSLHEPLLADAANPLCARCAAMSARRLPREVRPHGH